MAVLGQPAPAAPCGCYCSHGESSWPLWSHRSQEACQVKNMLVKALQGFAPNGWDHPKQAVRRLKRRVKDKSGPGKMQPSFLPSAHNLCAKSQRYFSCGRLMQCCASICSMFFEVNCRDALLWEFLPLHIALQPKQRSSSTESVYNTYKMPSVISLKVITVSRNSSRRDCNCWVTVIGEHFFISTGKQLQKSPSQF